MTENQNRLEELLGKYSRAEINEPEFDELCNLINDPLNDASLKDLLEQDLANSSPTEMDKGQLNRMLAKVLSKDTSTSLSVVRPSTPLRVIWRRIAATAAIIIAIAGGSYLLLNKEKKQEVATLEPQETRFKNDVAAPKITKATITLADGTTLSIDSLSNGMLAKQGNVKLVKTVDGKIVYSALRQAQGDIQFNTLTNPKGSKVIDMTLADGSQIWLNAGSSVTYPVAFIGNERKVTITGEAYLQVKHDAAKPFKLNANNKGEVEVMGTHFNVNAFENEDAVRTTLLEGKVKFTRTKFSVPMESKILAPGQQSVLRNNDLQVVNDVDVDQVMAWKNGLFKFKDATVKAIMKQIEVWYDVDVVFENEVTEHFITTIPRDVPVSQVLKYLETTGKVHFKIVGRKVTVLP